MTVEHNLIAFRAYQYDSIVEADIKCSVESDKSTKAKPSHSIDSGLEKISRSRSSSTATELPKSKDVLGHETQFQKEIPHDLHSLDSLPRLSITESRQRMAKLPCFMVENRLFNNNFIGRQDVLQKLDQLLLPNMGLAHSMHVVMWGLAGMGKSEIAIRYVFTRKDDYDAIFWVRADDKLKLEEGL